MAVKRLFLMVTLLLGGCGDDGAKAPKLGDTMLPFTAQSLGGQRFELPAGSAGKVVVLRFWATWCAFCKDEMKAIEPVWQARQGDGLLVLAVNAGQEAADITKFIADLGVSYPVLLDPGAKIARAYGVTGLPMTFFIDRSGVVRGRILGEADEAAFRRKLEDLL
ncbi:Putative thioredoxin-like fold [Magnetospirillum gryphiswaldense MSR-1 v2]|uniref:Thioredoxin-like fold n=1 Tax=Magnetospirillum gryphiswaldense (strain DSM 6361 / JCM 21280 / NBRC 15271 / MSR-1) TaxID=431944 RepID=V6EZ10_MAGGM|nr:TlpA disulfide reductase family protein [Magnetospirillum gryphiswaldense]CDK97468.1 Putative thioredoxin-like fold [Magnetospirillum gryphiswaldense MSR-1 v2]